MSLYLKKFSISIILSLIISATICNNAQCREVDIGLITSSEKIKIGSNRNAVLINAKTNNVITAIKKHETYTVSNSNGLINISHIISNTSIGAFTGPIKLIPDNDRDLVFCKDKWYRGKLSIFTNESKNQITIVNQVKLEDYLLSVVPSEIPSGWDKEALKAQSIAARSYALGYLGRRKEKGYDLESSVEDQLYLGVGSEKRSTTNAVSETKNLILVTDDNKPLVALFHSSAGGFTDSIENIWAKESSPHIMPVPDYDDNSPHFKWFRTYKLEEITKSLKNENVGNVTNIIPVSRSPSQRIIWVEVHGDKGKAKMRGDDFRRAIKLPSSKFNMLIKEDKVIFAGRGFGHGLGLSQWGAKALAEKGFSYVEILAHYYPGARLAKLNE